mmetsp:Transcript_5531/g.13673  ORF Transcript_5531/g.13673 Transcript_5531/m.13673 type:complete len:708 (+) Transcript_5531:379-2502(+)
MCVESLPLLNVLALFGFEQLVDLVHKPGAIDPKVFRGDRRALSLGTQLVPEVKGVVHHEHAASCIRYIDGMLRVVERLPLERVDQPHHQVPDEGVQLPGIVSYVGIPRKLSPLGNGFVRAVKGGNELDGPHHVDRQERHAGILHPLGATLDGVFLDGLGQVFQGPRRVLDGGSVDSDAQDRCQAFRLVSAVPNGHVAQFRQRGSQHSDSVQHSQSRRRCCRGLPDRQWLRRFSLGAGLVADFSLFQKDGFDNVHGLVDDDRSDVGIGRGTGLWVEWRDFVVDGILVGNLGQGGRYHGPVHVFLSGDHHHSVFQTPHRVAGRRIRRITNNAGRKLLGVLFALRLESPVVLIDAPKGDGLAGFPVGIHVGKSRPERALHNVGVHAAGNLFGPEDAVGGVTKVLGQSRRFVPVGETQLEAVAPEALKDSTQFSDQPGFDGLVLFELPDASQQIPILERCRQPISGLLRRLLGGCDPVFFLLDHPLYPQGLPAVSQVKFFEGAHGRDPDLVHPFQRGQGIRRRSPVPSIDKVLVGITDDLHRIGGRVHVLFRQNHRLFLLGGLGVLKGIVAGRAPLLVARSLVLHVQDPPMQPINGRLTVHYGVELLAGILHENERRPEVVGRLAHRARGVRGWTRQRVQLPGPFCQLVASEACGGRGGLHLLQAPVQGLDAACLGLNHGGGTIAIAIAIAVLFSSILVELGTGSTKKGRK